MNNCQNQRLHDIIFKTMALFVTISGILYLLRPICDPDFFWHLKTGEWIWHNKALPATDLYSFNLPPQSDIRAKFILTSYWLSQLWYYAWYTLSGWSGIFFARTMIVIIAVFFFLRWQPLRTQLHLSLVLLAIIQIFETYQLDRPQVFSFLLSAILIGLLDHIRNVPCANRSFIACIISLPVLTLVWSNLHGGFLVGQLIIIAIAVAEGIKFTYPAMSPMHKKNYYLLLGGSIVAICSSNINPNMFDSYNVGLNLGYNSNSFMYTRIKEYYNAYRSLTELKNYTVIISWFMLILDVICLIKTRSKHDITWFVLLLGTAIAGNLHVRYMPFFTIVSLMYLLRHIAELKTTFHRTSIIAFSISAMIFFSADEYGNLIQRYRYGSEPDPYYPAKAADYLIVNKIYEPMINIYGWGGYLIWRVGEHNNIFCDGRQLDPQRFQECADMFDRPDYVYWKDKMNQHGIKLAVLPVIYNKSPYWLTISLNSDPDWSLVFNQNNTAIFRKNTGFTNLINNTR